MILTVPWVHADGGPRPDLPEGLKAVTVLEDHGDTATVRISGPPHALEAARVYGLPVPDRIAARRWEAEVGGTTWEGFRVRTDRESQAMLTGALVMLSGSPVPRTVRWKFVDGWADLDAAGLASVASAVMGHVEACFSREEELVAAWEAGQPIDLHAGWPE